jgi:hypothetical protein
MDQKKKTCDGKLKWVYEADKSLVNIASRIIEQRGTEGNRVEESEANADVGKLFDPINLSNAQDLSCDLEVSDDSVSSCSKRPASFSEGGRLLCTRWLTWNRSERRKQRNTITCDKDLKSQGGNVLRTLLHLLR